MYFLLFLLGLISLCTGTEPCLGKNGSAAADQYECWNTNGILKDVKFPVCIPLSDRCEPSMLCNCPWCDDNWNCPTFKGCQENGGFLCVNSFNRSNQLWVCIPEAWKCDGIWDCPAGEDEGREFCDVSKCANNHNLTYWFQCNDTGRCISIDDVGNGQIDCVDGEDEDSGVIAWVLSKLTPTTAPSKITSRMPTMHPTQFLYVIELWMNVFGASFTEVCTQMDVLKFVLGSTLLLNETQISGYCSHHNFISPPYSRRMWEVSSDSSEDQSSSDEDNLSFRHSSQQLIARLTFYRRTLYYSTLRRILKFVDDIYQSDSSDSDEEEFEHSMDQLSHQLQVLWSQLLEKSVRVDVFRVSGNS